jgi:intracellular sulfur oxidation DsrE/DsrF family protein
MQIRDRLGRRQLLLAAAAAALLAGGPVRAQPPPVRAVYHFGEGLEQAVRSLQYIRNHLEADPKAQIVVVAHAAGVDFLMKGAKTSRGNEFRQDIEDLDLLGVKFRVCEITLRERGMQRSQFVPETAFVPSGVAEIARLQALERYVYIKP